MYLGLGQDRAIDPRVVVQPRCLPLSACRQMKTVPSAYLRSPDPHLVQAGDLRFANFIGHKPSDRARDHPEIGVANEGPNSIIRLMTFMQALRNHRPPVTAQRLADDTGVSLRTLYRDIESLRSMGAIIDGTAGCGYTLTKDAALPPMMFDDEEIEALVLGLREVQAIGDDALASCVSTIITA